MQREYFYSIDSAGRLFHDKSELSDPSFLDFFFQRIRPNNTGRHEAYPFISPCGNEMNFIEPAGIPVVFSSLEDGLFRYAASLRIPFNPDALLFQGGAILHPVSDGVLGRPGTRLAMELGAHIVPFGPWFAFQNEGRLHIIEPLGGSPDYEIFRPESGVQCFGCGADAKPGLYLPFLFQKSTKTALTWFSAPSWAAGHPGIVHGGFVSLFLDEAMAKVLKGLGLRGMTASLNVNFRKPAKTGEPLALKAELAGIDGRKIHLRAALTHETETLAEGTALYVVPASAIPGADPGADAAR